MKKQIWLPLLLAAALALPAALVASEFNTVLKIGDKAPAWSELECTEGNRYSLSDFDDKEIIVLAFNCNGCPIVVAYEERFVELQKDYAEKGVQFVSVNVNPGAGESLTAMKQRAEDRGFNFIYARDDTQQTARDYGARTTPHLFVLDKQRNVVYMGALDDSRNPNNVTKHYVRDAIDALLAGEAVPVSDTRPVGCGIRYQ